MAGDSKRKADGSNDSKSLKRSKIKRARDILAQRPDAAITGSSMDVPRFVEARKFEIEQLEKAMLKSKLTGRKRAFQLIPRGLRRRTASHNVKRVPTRLRNRAKQEMEADNTPPIKKQKLKGHERVVQESTHRKLQRESAGRPLKPQDHVGINCLAKPPKSKPKFVKRQRDKVWLPTHVWHSKRAHMVNRWGFSVVDRPSEKSYRATHRAHTVSGAIAWDTSYFGTMMLSGDVDLISKILCRFMSPLACSTVVMTGSRCWEGMCMDGEQSLGPGLVYWNSTDNNNKDVQRNVLIRLHPAIYEQVFSLFLTEAAQLRVECHDLRYALGSIDLLGSKSINAFQMILHPDESLDSTKTWKSLSGTANSTSLRSNLAITMDVADPRLFSTDKLPKASTTEISNITLEWPKYMASKSKLLSAQSRQSSYDSQLSLKELNRGKGAELRGEENPYKAQYNRYSIPIILLKRGDGESWTLLLPWGWVLPFWHCLVHIHHIRIGGLQQQHQLAFERGLPYFPVDYPNTVAGIAYETERRSTFQRVWERKPPAKRVTFEAVDTVDNTRGELGNPFGCDWEYLSKITNCPSLTQVKVKYLHRGSPSERARIYKVPDNSRYQWKSLLSAKAEIDVNEYPVCPGSDHLIGFITTGAFNLAQGTGFGIGSIISSANDPEQLCIVRNVGTNIARLAKWTAV